MKYQAQKSFHQTFFKKKNNRQSKPKLQHRNTYEIMLKKKKIHPLKAGTSPAHGSTIVNYQKNKIWSSIGNVFMKTDVINIWPSHLDLHHHNLLQ